MIFNNNFNCKSSTSSSTSQSSPYIFDKNVLIKYSNNTITNAKDIILTNTTSKFSINVPKNIFLRDSNIMFASIYEMYNRRCLQ